MSDKTVVTTMTGSETSPRGSASVNIFIVTSNGDEIPLNRSKGKNGVEQVGSLMPMFAAPGHIKELGQWFLGNYALPDNTILKVVGRASTKVSQGNRFAARRNDNASMYVRIRKNAPYYKVALPLTGDDRMAYAEAEFKGRFDICTEDLRHSVGVNVKPQFQKFCEDRNVSRVFGIHKLEDEIVPLAQYVKDTIMVDGEEATVTRRKRSRRMSI